MRREQAVELLLLRRQRRVVGLEPPQLGAHGLKLLAQPCVLEGGGGVDGAVNARGGKALKADVSVGGTNLGTRRGRVELDWCAIAPDAFLPPPRSIAWTALTPLFFSAGSFHSTGVV